MHHTHTHTHTHTRARARGAHLAVGGLLLLGGEGGRTAVGRQLAGQPVGAGLDGHAGAVEALREEHALAAEAVVGGGELQLGQGEGVAQVEQAVHVGVGEGAEELVVGPAAALLRGLHLENLGGLPLGLGVVLQAEEEVAPHEALLLGLRRAGRDGSGGAGVSGRGAGRGRGRGAGGWLKRSMVGEQDDERPGKRHGGCKRAGGARWAGAAARAIRRPPAGARARVRRLARRENSANPCADVPPNPPHWGRSSWREAPWQRVGTRGAR
jgi:hypothetical protein